MQMDLSDSTQIHSLFDYFKLKAQIRHRLFYLETLMLFHMHLIYMATAAVQKTYQRCLNRHRRKPANYREGGDCVFWFRQNKTKTYSCMRPTKLIKCLGKHSGKKIAFNTQKLCYRCAAVTIRLQWHLMRFNLELMQAKKKMLARFALQMKKLALEC